MSAAVAPAVDPLGGEGTQGGILMRRREDLPAWDRYLINPALDHGKRFMLGIPTTGLTRAEFWLAKNAVAIPCNWSCADRIASLPDPDRVPIQFSVQDARNLLVHWAITEGFDWLFFLDHDVLVPRHLYVTLNQYMQDGTIPIVSGLYCTKSEPAEPLVYRGRGNSYFRKWKLGDKVWCDGTGCGCLLISVKLLRCMYADAPEYLAGGKHRVRRVFETPSFQWFDTNAGYWHGMSGTEDLSWYSRVIEGGYLAKAGFPTVAKRRWPVLMDSSLFCRHIALDGTIYPRELRW